LLSCINTDNEEVLDAYAVLQRCTQLVKEKHQAGFAYAVLHDIQRRLVYEVRFSSSSSSSLNQTVVGI